MSCRGTAHVSISGTFLTVAFSVPPVFPRTASTISPKSPCRGSGIVSMGLLANILEDAVIYGLMIIAFRFELRTIIGRIYRGTLLHTGFDKAIQHFTVGGVYRLGNDHPA